MKKTYSILITLLIILASIAHAKIVINEIMYNPEGAWSSHEWVEIYNNGNDVVNIGSWNISDESSNKELTLIEGTANLEPGDYAIIANSDEGFLSDYHYFNGNLFDSSFGLSNDGEEIKLIDSSSNIIDTVTYSPDWGDTQGYSLELIDPSLDNTLQTSWELSYKAGGTPGKSNTEDIIVIGNFSEEAIDEDDDGKFDTLKISLDVNVTKEGKYEIASILNDKDSLLIGRSKESSYNDLEQGVQRIEVEFYGMEIYTHQEDGPFILGMMFIGNKEFQLEETVMYETEEYAYTDFQKPGASLTGSFYETVSDTDNDGLNDYFELTIELDVEQKARYSIFIQSPINMDKPSFPFEQQSFYLNPGVQNVTIIFEGIRIHQGENDGPYDLIINLDQIMDYYEYVDIDRKEYTTSPYSYEDFEKPGAKLTDDISDYGIDINEDGKYDYLSLNVTIDVTEPDFYYIELQVIEEAEEVEESIEEDTEEIDIEVSTIAVQEEVVVVPDPGTTEAVPVNEAIRYNPTSTRVYLEPGIHTLTINLSGLRIFLSQEDGPYDVSIAIRQGLNKLYLESETYTTKYYGYTEFEHPGLEVIGEFNDYGEDTDSNDFYDYLIVEIPISVSVTANYTVRADLLNTRAVVYDEIELSSEDDILQLLFKGQGVYVDKNNGPYDMQIEIMQNKQTIYKEYNYQTTDYEYNEFEPLDIENYLITEDIGKYLFVDFIYQYQENISGYIAVYEDLEDEEGYGIIVLETPSKEIVELTLSYMLSAGDWEIEEINENLMFKNNDYSGEVRALWTHDNFLISVVQEEDEGLPYELIAPYLEIYPSDLVVPYIKITSYSPKLDPAMNVDGSVEFSIDYVYTGNNSLTITWKIGDQTIETEEISRIVADLDPGAYEISITVTDGELIDSHSWLLTVTNLPFSKSYSGTLFEIPEDELEDATDITIEEPTYGSIDFGNQTINLSGVIDIDNYVTIKNGTFGIDTEKYPQFKIPAHIIMTGLGFEEQPIIYYNEGFGIQGRNPCPKELCYNVEWDGNNGILKFDVAHFSTYFVQANTAPIADAGTNMLSQLGLITLDGSNSYDLDNDALTYSWTQLQGPTVTLSDTTAQNPTFTAEEEADYTFQLIVNDGIEDSMPDNITIDIYGGVLEISKVSLSSDGNDDELTPGEELLVKVKIKNDGDDIDVEDIELTIWFEDDLGNKLEDDDGDNIEDDYEIDLDEGDSETIEFDFTMPMDVEDGDKYSIHIFAEGKNQDNNSIIYTAIDDSEEIEFIREKHEIRIEKLDLSPEKAGCSRKISVNIGVQNIGKEDEDDVKLTIINRELGLQKTESFELSDDLGDEDSSHDVSFSFTVDQDVISGIYPIEVKLSYGNKFKTDLLNLNVEDCVRVVEKKETAPTKTKIVKQPGTTPTKKEVKRPETVITFRESSTYLVLLASTFILMTGLIILAIGALIIQSRR